jgi:MYXO-CTERM domain-containing protein
LPTYRYWCDKKKQLVKRASVYLSGDIKNLAAMSCTQALVALRDANWLDSRRARAYLLILTATTVGVAVGYLALSGHGLDPNGKPLGTDFASFWTASQLALGGHPADAWTIEIHKAAQAATFGPDAGYAAFFYPPPYLLVCLPLALAPYLVALTLWLLLTGLAWVSTVRAWLSQAGARCLGWMPILAFPAALVNAGHGQNGFLTAALLGTGALICESRPWLAGVLFGALVIKPQLAILIPLFLLLAGNWRSFVAAGLTATGMCVISLAMFGTAAWQGFFDTSVVAGDALQQDLVGFAKMQSAYAAVRLMGGTNSLAWAVQMAAGLVGLGALWAVRRRTHGLENGAVLAGATPLTTPFLLDYDLTMLAVPLAWLFSRAHRDGFLPWERLVLLAGFILPLVSRGLATAAGIPLAPIVMLAIVLCVVRRAATNLIVPPASSYGQ